MRVMNGREEMRVVGTAHSVAEAIKVVDESRADVVLSAFRFPDGDATRLTEHVLSHFPETKVLILTEFVTPDVALQCVSAGCSGIISKDTDADEVATAIRNVHNGEVVMPPELMLNVLSGLRSSDHVIGHDITPREREMLVGLAQGLALAGIAVTMAISMNTARNYTQSVLEKLGAHSKLEAVVIALRAGIIDASEMGAKATLPN
jgi:DNA-binding NarL/FixJ family response regulator